MMMRIEVCRHIWDNAFGPLWRHRDKIREVRMRQENFLGQRLWRTKIETVAEGGTCGETVHVATTPWESIFGALQDIAQHLETKEAMQAAKGEPDSQAEV
jgi:hypothetical protein